MSALLFFCYQMNIITDILYISVYYGDIYIDFCILSHNIHKMQLVVAELQAWVGRI